jgi:hypothetical protein
MAFSLSAIWRWLLVKNRKDLNAPGRCEKEASLPGEFTRVLLKALYGEIKMFLRIRKFNQAPWDTLR